MHVSILYTNEDLLRFFIVTNTAFVNHSRASAVALLEKLSLLDKNSICVMYLLSASNHDNL